MAPPPRPPIICYDLQTNANLRRAPCTKYSVPAAGANRKTKVTVVNRGPNDLAGSTARACWHQHSFEDLDHGDDTENFPNLNVKTTAIQERKQTTGNNNDYYVRVARKSRPRPELVRAEPYMFNKSPFAQHTINDHDHHHQNYQQRDQTNRLNSNNVRFAYAKKLKHEAEEKERHREFRKQRLDMQSRVEDITAQLESVKRIHENLRKTFGMSHNAAKYFRLQDEEIGKLKRKLDQCVDIRSRELAQRDRQMKRSHELQLIEDQKAERRRMKDVSELTRCKRALSSTLNNSLSSNSQTTNSASNTQSSSSTISISSCSSPMSIDDQIPSVHFVESPPSSVERMPHVSSSTPSRNFLHKDVSSNKIISHKPPDFSFYKRNPLDNETIEVTDIDFFEKVEDKTMIEVNNLFSRIRTALDEMNLNLK